jgi:hypothetical protein
MAVAETAASQGKGASGAGCGVGRAAFSLGLGASLPLANIQTPSAAGAAGVSRNSYRQFDVSAKGLIPNNSRTDVNTQLGG